MKTKEISILKINGLSADSVYKMAASRFGLFGVAFFGHKATKGQREKLSRVWKRICSVYYPETN